MAKRPVPRYDFKAFGAAIKAASGVFCVCKKENGKFLYEIMESTELLKERNRDKYTVYGIAGGKREAFEVFRTMVEDTNAY